MDIIQNMNVIEIQKYQQNRYPLFYVDKITEVMPGKYAKGYKNFTYNEWFFPAHFEDNPNVPSSIQLETLTQVFLMTFLTIPEYQGKQTACISVNNMKFKKKIVPGDRLEVEAKLDSFKRGLAKGSVVGKVENEIACCLEIEVVIPDVIAQFIP